MKNLEKALVFAILAATVALLLTGCSSTPRVENVRAVRGQESYQFGQEPEQRRIENGGRQYDRHVRSLQDARLRHEETMVRMEYEKREREYARTNGLASPQSSAQSLSGPPVVFQQQAWPPTRAPVAFMQLPTSSVTIIGPDELIDGSRPVREVRELNGFSQTYPAPVQGSFGPMNTWQRYPAGVRRGQGPSGPGPQTYPANVSGSRGPNGPGPQTYPASVAGSGGPSGPPSQTYPAPVTPR